MIRGTRKKNSANLEKIRLKASRSTGGCETDTEQTGHVSISRHSHTPNDTLLLAESGTTRGGGTSSSNSLGGLAHRDNYTVTSSSEAGSTGQPANSRRHHHRRRRQQHAEMVAKIPSAARAKPDNFEIISFEVRQHSEKTKKC